jgi:hypothetical protein
MINAPFSKPDPPIPATALPIINMIDDLAAPQMADPTMKSTTQVRKTRWRYQQVGITGQAHFHLGIFGLCEFNKKSNTPWNSVGNKLCR